MWNGDYRNKDGRYPLPANEYGEGNEVTNGPDRLWDG